MVLLMAPTQKRIRMREVMLSSVLPYLKCSARVYVCAMSASSSSEIDVKNAATVTSDASQLQSPEKRLYENAIAIGCGAVR